MRLLLSLARVTGFATTAPAALLLGLAALLVVHRPAHVPTLSTAVPPAVLVPMLSVLALSWTLHDRWPEVTRTAARSPRRVAAARLIGTAAVCAVPALVAAAAWHSLEPAAVSVLGVGLTAAASTVLGRRAWLLVLPAGYLWLRYAAPRPLGTALEIDPARLVLLAQWAGRSKA